MATLGATVPAGDCPAASRLPSSWVACLALPADTRKWRESAVIKITLPAFDEFALTVAAPMRH